MKSIFTEDTYDIQKEETNARVIPWAILASVIIALLIIKINL